MFQRVLIANRGEIARRIVRTCSRLNIQSIAVYSESDYAAPFVTEADQAVALKGYTAPETYLSIEQILLAAQQSQAEAIHPGYGFLSENAEFARQIKKAGLKFIGPEAESMLALGDKLKSKELARKLGIACLPEVRVDAAGPSKAQLLQIKSELSYPLLIKASGAGGGRGMRVVYDPAQLTTELQAATNEARKFFSDSDAFIEQYLPATRHIEVQFIADQHKQVRCFYERDCSMQRSHQKVIEEAPAAGISNQLRQKLYSASAQLAIAAGYCGAGTAEFLVTPDERYYFLEVNSRLQVEHPVTEILTGFDLVEIQLRVANAEKLQDFCNFPEFPDTQLHVIEARLCAEKPQNSFAPATGRILEYSEPTGTGCRIDSGVTTGSSVSTYFDSLLAKIIVSANSRPQAITKLQQALAGFHIAGVATNNWYLQELLADLDFQQGLHLTSTAAKLNLQKAYQSVLPEALALAALCEWSHWCQPATHSTFYPKLAQARPVELIHNQEYYCPHLQQLNEQNFIVEIGTRQFEFELLSRDSGNLTWRQAGQIRHCHFTHSQQGIWLTFASGSFYFGFSSGRPQKGKGTRAYLSNMIRSELPGTVLQIPVKTGARLSAGETLIVLESMKMEHTVKAQADLVISKILVQAGQSINNSSDLLEVKYL